MSDSSLPLPASPGGLNPASKNPYAAPPPPDFSISACLVECPTSQDSALTYYLDVRENQLGVTFPNVVAECQKGSWNIFWGFDSAVRWVECHPLAAMRAPCPPFVIDSHRQQEFDDALIEQIKKLSLNFLLAAEYESRYVPGFRSAVRELDWDENRVPVE